MREGWNVLVLCVLTIPSLTYASRFSETYAVKMSREGDNKPTFTRRAKLDQTIIFQDTTAEISDEAKAKINNLNRLLLTADSVDLTSVKNNPYLSVGDYLVGQSAGVYVQNPTAEPGTYQNILLRGLSSPQFNNRDITNNQAVVYVNGIPMGQENNFAYDIQRYDYNRIGPATDYLSSIDLSAIKSIEIIKDPIRLAELGPLASNGVIWITTHGGRSGKRQISVNGYYGFNTKPVVTPYNAQYEDLFRKNFYSKYGTIDDVLKYPGYLADSTNLNYYGNADWSDLYYSTSSLYSLDMMLNGGTDRANFGFFGSHTRNAISSDDADLQRYNVLININMLPFEWFKVSTYLNGRRLDRGRNRNLRDRYAEMAYLPDLSTPLSPNKEVYQKYIDHYKREVVDDNVNTNFQGNLNLSLDILKELNFTTSFSVDYNEGVRDLFYPSTLMETINYMSTYYGYTQRFVFSNRLSYNKLLENDHLFKATIGSDYSEDVYRYNYARAYDGPNDYIKLNVVEGNSDYADYLQPKGGLRVLRWNNKEQFHLHSLYSKFDYAIKDLVDLEAVLRWDGSSTVQRDSRWLFTPGASARWHIDKNFGLANLFNVKLAYSRIGKPVYNSRYATGPQYAANLGWTEDPTVSSYYGFAGISRDYSFGWTGYNLKWAYSDKLELAINNSFLKNRLTTVVAFYQTDDKDQIVLAPVPSEFGYVGQYKNGLTVRNQGVDISANAIVSPAKENALGWTVGLNLNVNSNKVTALPEGLQELKIGANKLKVGEAVDNFWLLENQGIYTASAQIPSGLTNNGVAFAVGDANWVDQNKDKAISEDDKVFKGRFTPKFFGGFNNTLTYKGVDLHLAFTYALGHKALNQRASNRYDFINNESKNSIHGIREIFQWQQDVDISKYPYYNVWSGTAPYRLDQDLFLEDASYLKLRSLSMGYDLSKLSSIVSLAPTVRRAYVYLTANNLFTVTKFSGNDPELVNFNGIYDGYGLPLTKTFTLGLKLDL
ncbi:SusC/RagA family TonB-linked outer membrane protein [Sphingobacterium sp. SGG-5]|uniref:SusC/RagA family TonB-linked outer membrane protein n=1 Tax=Sphingobacterium sp. SGG-5 TaxID=2710881 RepID=UPI0013EA19ED|nr:SusC/RagA family TonB-linked outer membrane protein [Sphingobacterium sp. SGG-5]NGM61604.1 SusC/RagA family TonB-linked outer membrane protein [Sphingobacterium sp. SGG-5]